MLGHRRAADIIYLAADTGELTGTDGFCIDLPHQVHLNCGVDGNHVVIAGNHIGMVGVIHGIELHIRVVVHEIIESLGAHHHGGDKFAGVEGLPLVVNHARLRQIHHAVGECLGVNAQVLFILEET